MYSLIHFENLNIVQIMNNLYVLLSKQLRIGKLGTYTIKKGYFILIFTEDNLILYDLFMVFYILFIFI